ncbi:MAG: hypothetical protein WBD16_12105 [Pyrinomonadaceae bacterium]
MNIKIFTTKFATLALLLTFVATPLCVLGQSSLDDEIERLKKAKELAELKQQIAEAKKAAFEAKFPTPDADALRASTETDGNRIETRILAYQAMDAISGKIADDMPAGITRLYLHRDEDYAKIAAYKKLIQRVKIINAEYMRCSPGGAGIAGVPIGTLLNWLPLFKTDTVIKSAEFDVEDEAVVSSLANSLRKKGVSLSMPFGSAADFAVIGGVGPSTLRTELESAERNKASSQFCQNPYPLRLQLDAAFDALKDEIGLGSASPSSPEMTEKKTATAGVPPNTTVTETTVKNPASSTPVKLTFWDYMRIEELVSYMNTNQIYWIKIKNVKSGGNMRIKSSPLIDIFRGGNSVKFSGGSVAYYIVFDNDGTTRFSGVVNSYVPYKKSKDIK